MIWIHLNSRVGDMKKQLSVKAQSEIDSLLEKTREMATKEAEIIINASKEKATAESVKISQAGDAKLSEIQSSIDANFDEAVKHVVCDCFESLILSLVFIICMIQVMLV